LLIIMMSKELTPICIDVMNPNMSRIIDYLLVEKREMLSFVNQPMGGVLDAMLDM